MDTAARPAFRNATAADVPALVALIESAYRGDDSRAGWTTEADILEGQRTDPEGVLALYSSFSVIGGLPPARRDAALEAFREVLDRHDVRTAELHYRAILTTARPT